MKASDVSRCWPTAKAFCPVDRRLGLPAHALDAFLVGGLLLSAFVADNALLMATARTIQAGIVVTY